MGLSIASTQFCFAERNQARAIAKQDALIAALASDPEYTVAPHGKMTISSIDSMEMRLPLLARSVLPAPSEKLFNVRPQ